MCSKRLSIMFINAENNGSHVVNSDLENEYISHFTSSFVMSVAAHERVYGNLVSSRNTNRMQSVQRLAELNDGIEDQRINLKRYDH
jgi:hypothetical protein